jgi:hypothetical protein
MWINGCQTVLGVYSYHAYYPTILYIYIYLEILQDIKYDVIMILLYDSLHYRGDII